MTALEKRLLDVEGALRTADKRTAAAEQALATTEKRLRELEQCCTKPASNAGSLEPSIELGQLKDDNQRPLDPSGAPYKLFSSATVANATGLFACLVVDDQNKEWVEPGCRKVVGNRFDGVFYLGIEKDPASLGKQYKLYGVLSKRAFIEYTVLDRDSVVATSTPTSVRRTR